MDAFAVGSCKDLFDCSLSHKNCTQIFHIFMRIFHGVYQPEKLYNTAFSTTRFCCAALRLKKAYKILGNRNGVFWKYKVQMNCRYPNLGRLSNAPFESFTP